MCYREEACALQRRSASELGERCDQNRIPRYRDNGALANLLKRRTAQPTDAVERGSLVGSQWPPAPNDVTEIERNIYSPII